MKLLLRCVLLLCLAGGALLPVAVPSAAGPRPKPSAPRTRLVPSKAPASLELRVNSLLGVVQSNLYQGRLKEAAAALESTARLVPAGSPLDLEIRLCRAELELMSGKPELALLTLSPALAAARARKDQAREVSVLLFQGRALLELRRPAEARAALLTALQSARRGNLHAGELRAQLQLGRSAEAMDQGQQARESYLQARQVALRMGDRTAEVEALQGLARGHRELREMDRALTLLELAAEICGQIGDRYRHARVLYDLGCYAHDAARDVNDDVRVPQALKYMGQAWTLWETLPPRDRTGSRPGSPSPLEISDRNRFLALWLSYGMPFAAFKWSQKFKTMTLEAELLGPGIHTTGKSDSQKGGTPAIAERIGRAIVLDQVIDFLPSDTLLLDYTALEGMTVKHAQGDLVDPIICFRAETGTGEPTLRWGGLRDLNCTDVRREVESFRRQCASGDIRYAEGAQRLYRMLLAPIQGELRNVKRLVICADGPLRGLPFHALLQPVENGRPRFLMEDYEIVYAHSASSARAALKGKTPALTKSGALVICEPTAGGPLPALKFARAEEAAIRQALPVVESLRGGAASETVIRTALPRYGLVHFAGHTLVNDRSPWESGLLLAPSMGNDGRLTAAEVLDLKLTAGLVVLSSCRTASGQTIQGDGVSGLACAFFAAGAKSQLLTLWEVVDESTSVFMLPFYRSLAIGESRAGAVRKAAREMLKHPRFSHPRYWAPFVLWGDWR